MRRQLVWVVAGLACTALQVRAIETDGGFDSTEPGFTQWESGWGAEDVTGWDYVGSIGATGGVYLGDDWVLTAAHVGASTFILDSGPGAGTYQPTGTSYSFSNADGSVDLTLFQISNGPSSSVLPPLSLTTSSPNQFLYTSTGANAVMIGYGDNGALNSNGTPLKTWGQATIDFKQFLPVSAGPTTYYSTDLVTVNGTVSNGSTTSTNNSQIVNDDSGGASFVYNSYLGIWQLAGINEAIGSDTLEDDNGVWKLVDTADAGATNVQDVSFSAMVNVSSYSSSISQDDGIAEVVPEPPAWMLALAGLAVFGGIGLGRRGATSRV